MANYPSGLTILVPAEFTTQTRADITPLELGTVLRRKRWAEPLYRIRFNHDLEMSDYATLERFFRESTEGQVNAFTFTDPISRSWEDVWVNTGDGSTTVFDLPAKTSTSRTLYVDDVGKSEGSDWTFGSGTGADGRDRATFSVAPSAGERISYDFTGYRAWYTIFANNDLKMKFGKRANVLVTVDLLEVRS